MRLTQTLPKYYNYEYKNHLYSLYNITKCVLVPFSCMCEYMYENVMSGPLPIADTWVV